MQGTLIRGPTIGSELLSNPSLGNQIVLVWAKFPRQVDVLWQEHQQINVPWFVNARHYK